MKEITFKEILDNNGDFKKLELHQGDNVIVISMGNVFASGDHSYVWECLKRTVDKIQERNRRIAQEEL